MLIMLREPLPEGARQQADFAALAGTDVSTYNVKVPVQTRSNNIEYVISHLPQPLEYGVEPGKSGSPVFGIFTMIGDEKFAMRGRLLTADLQESVPLPSMFGDDEAKYYWDEAADKMRAIRPTDAWGATTNPAVRDRTFILEQDLLAVMNDKLVVQLLMRYLGALFEASDKYLKTDNDTDIFFRILERHRFPHIERQTRKTLWNVSRAHLELLVHILARHIEGSSHITEPDKTALQSTLSTLSSFVTSVTSQAWPVRPAQVPRAGQVGPVQRLRDSVAQAMHSLGAFATKQTSSASNDSGDESAPSVGQEADNDTAIQTVEADRRPAPVPPVMGSSDQNVPLRQASLIPDTAVNAAIQTSEAGTGPVPIPSITASSEQAAPDLHTLTPEEGIDAASRVAEAGDPISVPSHAEETMGPSAEQPSASESGPRPQPPAPPPPPRELTSDEVQPTPEAIEPDATPRADVQAATVMPPTAVRETSASGPDKQLPPVPSVAQPPADTLSQVSDKRPGAKSFLESIRSRLSPRSKTKAEQNPVSKPVKSRGLSFWKSRKKSGGSRSPRGRRV